LLYNREIHFSGASILNSPLVLKHEIGLPVYSENNKIYPKRMSGRFRLLKWWTASLWLVFFFGPHLRWNDNQAILLDIPARKFHFFSLTIYPQDLWLLSFVLLFFAMLLILVTLVAGRVFCGYFCFQTVWTDIYTWIEEKIEGPPRMRQQLDQAAWSLRKFSIKLTKHVIWLTVALLTGISFAAWFTDVWQLWADYFRLNAHISAWIVLATFSAATYLFAGFMREQVCCWLCPYARIQGALSERDTIFPTYDFVRGEPRSNRKVANQTPLSLEKHVSDQSLAKTGDCVDCDLCVAVCPTGVDIRDGQQIGCITCGLCIDACDHVMSKINRPSGLIRYTSLASLTSGQTKPWYKLPLVIISAMIIGLSIIFIVAGVNTISEFSISVYHDRQPEYIKLSSGEIRNRYQLKLQNKTNNTASYVLSINGLDMVSKINQQQFKLPAGQALTHMIYIDVPLQSLPQKVNPISFNLLDDNNSYQQFQTVFIGPKITN